MTEEADREEEQAAYRVFDAWRRAEKRSVGERPSQRVLALIRARFDEFSEEALYDAAEGARFAPWFKDDAARRVPELVYRDARNVRSCAEARPRRRVVPLAAPVAPRPAAAGDMQTNIEGAGRVLAALR